MRDAKTGWRWAAVAGCATMLACALVEPRETTYLRSASGQATQEEVTRHLGAPTKVLSGATGETLWVYQIREEQPGNRWTSIGMWCDEYVLTFDERAVLQTWTHAGYLHGGELQPDYCVPGGVDGK